MSTYNAHKFPDSTNAENLVNLPFTVCLQGADETERGAAVSAGGVPEGEQGKTTQVHSPFLGIFVFSHEMNFLFLLQLSPQSLHLFPSIHPLPVLNLSAPSLSYKERGGDISVS